MSGWRDARLQKALESAPDAQLLPQPGTRQAILARAHQASSPPTKPESSWWQRLWSGSGRQHMPWNAAFATIALATLVTVLWHDREVPGPRSEAPQADQPANSDMTAGAPAAGGSASAVTRQPGASVSESTSAAVTRPEAAPPVAQARSDAARPAPSTPPTAGKPAIEAPAAVPPAASPPPAQAALPSAQVAPAPAPAPARAPAPSPAPAFDRSQSDASAGAMAPAETRRLDTAPAAPAAAGSPPATQRAEKSAASSSPDNNAAPTGALAKRQPSPLDGASQLRILSAGRSVDVPLRQPSRLADLLAAVIAGARSTQPLESTVTLRIEVGSTADATGVLEIAGLQVRWQELRGGTAESRTATPEAALLQALREELDAALGR
jgi:hypothetical protein